MLLLLDVRHAGFGNVIGKLVQPDVRWMKLSLNMFFMQDASS